MNSLEVFLMPHQRAREHDFGLPGKTPILRSGIDSISGRLLPGALQNKGQAYTEYVIILAVWFVTLGYVVAGSGDISKHLFSGFVEVGGSGNTNMLSLLFDFYSSLASYINLPFL